MDMLGATDYYALLEIPRTATAAEISASYRRLARIKHPDKNRDNPNATVLFQELQSAYSVLKDAAARRDYDVKFNAAHVQQEQIRLFQQHRQKAAYAGVKTFNVKNWHQTSGFYNTKTPKDPWMTDNASSTKYPPSPPDKGTWPDRPPPTDEKLEKDIQAARNEIVQKDKLVASLDKELKEKQNLVAALWQISGDVEHMKVRAQRKQAQIHAAHQDKMWHAALSRGYTEWNFPTLQSVPIVKSDGSTVFEDIPVVPDSAPIEPLPMDAADAETLRGLEAALEKLAVKAAQATADIEKTTVKIRDIASETKKINKEKATTEATLRELSRRWRIQHFGVGAGTDCGCSGKDNDVSKHDEAAGNETGFDMWAAWGDNECGSDGAPEWPDNDVDPDWDHHRPYYDEFYPVEEEGDDDEAERTERPSWSAKEPVQKATAEKTGFDNAVEQPAAASKEHVDSSGSSSSRDADKTQPANSPVSEDGQAAPLAIKESVWNAYKELSAKSPTSAATPQDATASDTLKPKPKPKPMSRRIDNVWAAKDGDLIDLGWGNDEDYEEPSTNTTKNGQILGELPRRWYGNGQAAHDELRHDSWNNDTWQRETCYEW